MTTESNIGRSTQHAIELWYGTYRLIPAPFLEWVVDSEHDDNTKVRSKETTRLKLTGSFVITPNGSYEQMMTMQNSLRTAFSVDGYEFKILAGNGNATLASGTPIVNGIYPQITNVTINPDVQYNKLDYSVDMFVSSSSVSGQAVTDLNDNWQLSENQDGWFLDITHNVSAKGINTLSSGTNAIIHARDAVYPRLGLSNLPYYLPYYTEPKSSGGASIQIYEVGVNRTESVDVLAGNYSVSEKFIISSGTQSYVHNQTATFEEDENTVATVTLQGEVIGAGRTNYNTDGGIGFTNAVNGYHNYIKPSLVANASGVYNRYKNQYNDTSFYLFTTKPVSYSISENKYQGVVRYTVRYTDDPKENLPSGILEATTSVQRIEGIRVKATHPIPFRRLGNIIQDIKTTTEGQIVISSNAKAENTGNASTDTNKAISYVQSEINRLRPSSVDFETLRVGGVQSTYSDKELTSSASVTYIFTVDLASVASPDGDITLPTL